MAKPFTTIRIDDVHDPFTKAIAMQRRKLLQPKEPLDLIIYAALCISDGQYEEAEHWLDVCLEMWPDNPMALHQKSIIYLTNGDYERGYELFDHRFVAYPQNNVGPPCPQWDGQPTEQLVLLWQEGGFGDTIQSARFIPEVVRRCPNVFLMVHDDVRSLLELSGLADGTEKVPTPWHQEQIDTKKAVQCALTSLPRPLHITLDTLDGSPYLSVPQDLIAAWQLKLNGQPKIGFCWSGSPQWERDCIRSMSLDDAKKLSAAIECMPLVQQHTGAKDWSDTAAIIMNMDLVISTCTSISHCAAALGKPTWVLLAKDCDWRWGRSYARFTPWYKSARLFRQPDHGNWNAVIKEVYATLRIGVDGLQAHPKAETIRNSL